MDRRSFLTKTSLATAGGLAVATLGTPKAKAIVVDGNLFGGAGTIHDITTANHFAGHNNYMDWHNISAIHTRILNFWKVNNMDVVLKPAYNRLTESQMYIGNLPVDRILASIQVYNPRVTRAQVYDSLQTLLTNTVHNGVDRKVTILNQLRTVGMAPYIQNAAYISSAIATKMGYKGPGVLPPPPKPTPYGTAPPITDPHNHGCEYSAWGMWSVGLALGVITIMTDGGDILAFAGWEMINYWGGRAMMGWSAIHSMYCGV